MIAFRDVTVQYESVPALSELTDDVHAGEWVGLIGPNGAGKTTLLRAVARLVSHEGSITVDGEDLSSLSPKRLARLVAYVPQQPELPPDMTVGQYVLLGRTPHIGYFGFDSAVDRTVCGDLLDSLDLWPMAQRRLSTLSGGELQRLVLARALAQQAPVLLLDEPTSALDLGRRVEALELVDGLRHERGLTVLSALHDLTLAGQFADRLMLLHEGRAVSTGKPDEVLTEESLARHFGASVRVMRSEDGDLVVVPQRRR
jgi:iron complex transport system ATP-binding protein